MEAPTVPRLTEDDARAFGERLGLGWFMLADGSIVSLGADVVRSSQIARSAWAALVGFASLMGEAAGDTATTPGERLKAAAASGRDLYLSAEDAAALAAGKAEGEAP